MAANETCSFDEAFRALTERGAFPWQRALYERLIEGDVPRLCDIPTGLGKTAVVAVWLIALTKRPDQIPRRLVYVVNRRTVVDQTTNEVLKLRNNAIRLGIGELAISTLRGQFADNREWSADPARPAVVVGTVDMIGSRLLFRGYGVGFKGNPLHAGFLGQDVLLVHDEAHLEPAFQKLIEAIEHEQKQGERTADLPWRKLTVMALSATTRCGAAPASAQAVTLTLTDREKQVPEVIPDPPTEPIHHVWRRLSAKKRLELHNAEDEKLAEEIAKLALEHKASGTAILIYVRTIQDVNDVCKRLHEKKSGLPPDSVQQLTGTMRGFERDQLVNSSPLFARFLPPSDRPEGMTPVSGTVYLVCTSAGEVGVNISADHMVCDLSTFESMVQRFGRVNRFGDGESRIDVVYPAKFDEKDRLTPAYQATLKLLRQLDGDASPRAIARLDPAARLAAFAPEPTILPPTDILFDAWALTTIRQPMPGRPPVGPYLHGIADWEPPETRVAWREEVGIVTGDLLDSYRPQDLLEDYPLKPHELLRDRSDRVFKHLAAIPKRHGQDPVWLVDDFGHVEVLTLDKLTDKKNKDRINYRTVLLSPSLGGLRDGFLDSSSEIATDVADEWFADHAKTVRRRIRVWDDDPVPPGMRLIRIIDTRPYADEIAEEAETHAKRYWHWYELRNAGETEGSTSADEPVAWQMHTDDVTRNVRRIAEALDLPDELKQALTVAAKFHDLGKKRQLWQRSIGNPNPDTWYAKSGRDPRTGCRWTPLDISEYRHEFGSLLDVDEEPEFQELSEEMKDLVLHLIAASHGRARPHFPPDEAFDPEHSQAEAETLAAEVPRRFARLQRKYGRWGLAYLESLLRAADYAASANPSGPAGDLKATQEPSL